MLRDYKRRLAERREQERDDRQFEAVGLIVMAFISIVAVFLALLAYFA